MNIFVIDECPQRSAMQLHDKHIIKMVLESCQLMSTARQLNGYSNVDLYKPTHQKHPCTLWVAESKSNYLWLFKHFISLSAEYTYRYGRIHKCMSMVTPLTKDLNEIHDIGLTKFAIAMPDKYKTNDVIKSYRSYYVGEKIQNKMWTRRLPEELDDWLSGVLETKQFK